MDVTSMILTIEIMGKDHGGGYGGVTVITIIIRSSGSNFFKVINMHYII